MIEVRIPKEITDYEAKIFFGMSGRKLISFGIAVAISFILFFALRGVLSLQMLGRIAIIIDTPIVAVGFLHKNGLTMEKWIPIILKHKLNNHKLTYVIDENDCEDKKEAINKHAANKETVPEWHGYYVQNKKALKQKRKITSSKIKAAKEESRTARRRLR